MEHLNETQKNHMIRATREATGANAKAAREIVEESEFRFGAFQGVDLRDVKASVVERNDDGSGMVAWDVADMRIEGRAWAGIRNDPPAREDVWKEAQEELSKPFEAPFFTKIGFEAHEKAASEIGHAQDAIKYDDETIAADAALVGALRFIEKQELPKSISFDSSYALAAAAARYYEHAERSVVTPSEGARMVAYDYLSQYEANGLVAYKDGPNREAGWERLVKAADVVEQFGIRTLSQESADDSPLRLGIEDLRKIALGSYEEVDRVHAAGLSMGMHYARDAVTVPMPVSGRVDLMPYDWMDIHREPSDLAVDLKSMIDKGRWKTDEGTVRAVDWLVAHSTERSQRVGDVAAALAHQQLNDLGAGAAGATTAWMFSHKPDEKAADLVEGYAAAEARKAGRGGSGLMGQIASLPKAEGVEVKGREAAVEPIAQRQTEGAAR